MMNAARADSILYRAVSRSWSSWLPLLLLATGLNTSLLFGWITAAAARGQSSAVPPAHLGLLFWSGLALYLILGYERRRCDRLELTLPLPAHRLWLGHLAAVYSAGLAFLGVGLGGGWLMARVAVRLQPSLEASLTLRRLVPLLLASLLLAVALFERDDPPQHRIRGGFAGLLRRLLVVVAIGAVVWVLSGRPIAWSLLLAGLAAVSLVNTYRSLPGSFLLLPERPVRRPVRGRTGALAAPSAAGSAPRSAPGKLRWRLLVRILYDFPPWGPVTAWVELLAAIFIGALFGGLFELFLVPETEGMRFTQLPLVVYMLVVLFAPLTTQMSSLDPLPISRRVLFASVIVPSLLAMVAGYATVRLIVATRPATPLVEYRIEEPHAWVGVQEALMSATRTGPPILESPWGETHTAWHRPLFKGGELVLYSPYSTTEETSARFEALMLSRAIAAGYGLQMPWEEALERYFEVDGDKIVGLKHEGVTGHELFAGVEPRSRGPISVIALTMAIVPFFLLLALFLRTFRATVSDRRRRAFYWSFLAALLIVMIGGFTFQVAGWFNQRVGWAILESLAFRWGQSPTAMVLTWLLCCLGMVAAYWLAQRAFQRIELPATPTKFTLVDFAKE